MQCTGEWITCSRFSCTFLLVSKPLSGSRAYGAGSMSLAQHDRSLVALVMRTLTLPRLHPCLCALDSRLSQTLPPDQIEESIVVMHAVSRCKRAVLNMDVCIKPCLAAQSPRLKCTTAGSTLGSRRPAACAQLALAPMPSLKVQDRGSRGISRIRTAPRPMSHTYERLVDSCS